MNSLFKKIAGIIALGVPLLSYPTKIFPEDFLYLGMNASLGAGTSLFEINNVLEEPISFSPSYGSLELKSGIGTRNFFLDFEIGPKIELSSIANNYVNATQGYNLNIDVNGDKTFFVIPGVSAKASFLKSLYVECSADFGYGLYLEKEGLCNGNSKLADLIDYKIKLGLDYPLDYKNGTKIGFCIGTEIPQFLNETFLAYETGLEGHPNFFVEMKIEFFDFQIPLGE